MIAVAAYVAHSKQTQIEALLAKHARRTKWRMHDDRDSEIELTPTRVLVDEGEVAAICSEVEGADANASGGGADAADLRGGADLRYAIEPNEMITGQRQDAARGINSYLCISDDEVFQRMLHGGVKQIALEVEQNGTDEDKECLDYILNRAAGSSDKVFPNGVRDRGRHGERFADFVSHPHSRRSGLTEAHVLALRLYTSAAYKSINVPLRQRGGAKAPHPFPITVILITDGLKRLRAIAASRDATPVLWRGMRNLQVRDAFLAEGGTEIAPMSATSDMRVALRYALKPHTQCLLMRFRIKHFMACGVDLAYLSCFPEEKEHLYPPLTFLAPSGHIQTIEIGSMAITVIEVEPIFGT